MSPLVFYSVIPKCDSPFFFDYLLLSIKSIYACQSSRLKK